MSKDLYAELGVARGASAEEIRKAYRSLASKLHPDRNPDNPAAEERFKRVNYAHQVLGDERRRKLYDEFGEAGLREGFDPAGARAYGRGPSMEDIFGGRGGGGAGFGDIFSDLFGGGRGGRRRTHRSPDIESEISIEFASAVRGAELELSLAGAGRVKVRIPAGAADGDRLRVQGAGGSAAPGLPPGDLLLTVRVKAHPHFDRDGLDLTLELPITALEAYDGAKIEVPTPTGSVQLKIPPGAQSGQLLRLRGKGVERGTQQGDLYVRFLVKLPKARSDELQEAARLLADATDQMLRENLTF